MKQKIFAACTAFCGEMRCLSFVFARLAPSRFFVGVPPLISGKQGMRENGFSKETSYEVFTREWLYDSIRKSGTPACLSGERAEANLVYERVDPKWFG